MTRPTLREWLFALAMSSGFFGFFAHAGALSVLEDEQLLPDRLAGSSAGALITGLWSSGVDAARMKTELLTLERAHFWDPAPGAGLLRGRLFREKLESILAVKAFSQTRRPLSISVFALGARRTEVRVAGELAPAIHASCALPGLFHPVRLEGRLYSDGGILDRPGFSGFPEGTRLLYHHLSSKSPWRRATSPALQVPRRAGMTTVVLDGLTRVNPFALTRGATAYEEAAQGLRAALGRPVEDGVVRLAVG
jgi:NTE family protein